MPKASIAASQVVVKNVWPDGSAKFAVVSGRASLTAGSALLVTLVAAAPTAAGNPLTTADLRATGVIANIGAGSFGTVNWSGTDWDAPFLSWVSGPEMSSWIYRKPVGSDAHLVAWLEVRLYAGGAVEVLPWIENGYVRVANPTNKSATYTFTLGGSQRFGGAIDLPHHTRTPLISGAALSHWLGADPGVTPKHDRNYLQGTKLVPAYSAVVADNADIVNALVTTYTPLQVGNFTATMGVAGYQGAIGLLPQWDVLYLTSNAQVAYGAVVRNGFSAGRWGIHYRDERSNRPLRFSQFPNLSTNSSSTADYPPSASGTAPGLWDIPHHPSTGYMAYLVTGRWYFMEQVLFAATHNYLFQVDTIRQTSAGIFRPSSGASTLRGAAWALRTLAQAATVVPDDDTVIAGEFIASLEANMNFNHARYVAQPNNPFGFVETYGDNSTPSDGIWTTATWQQDFFTAVAGYMVSMKPPVSATVRTKISQFFQWKAKSIIGRLGANAPGEWLYRDAAPYTIALAATDAPNWDTGAGPWPANWRALYDLTYGGVNLPSPGPFENGPLRGGNVPDPTSYWGNLQPALAYAVEHGAPGATEAMGRMTSASNWPALRDGFNLAPVWGVRPGN